jgi:hypothetical protein
MGIYNGKSIYNGNAIYNGKSIYNGDALYKENGSGSNKTLFLSKFDHYDDDSQQDIPDVGDPYIFDPTLQSVKHTVVFLFGKYMNAIRDTYIKNDYVGFSKTIEDKFISSEAWMFLGGSRSDFGVFFCIGPEIISCDPNFSTTEWGRFGPYIGGSNIDSYTLYNGTTNAPYSYLKFGSAPRNIWFFYSCVYDVDQNEISFFINGDLMAIVRYNTPFVDWSFNFRQSNKDKYTEIAYAAVFGYDKRENGGTSYPVTTL